MPICKFNKCKKYARYSQNKNISAKFCRDHRPEGYIDIVSKLCEYKDCTTQAIFNDPSLTTPKFCKAHKGENHINVKNKRCQHKGCLSRALYGPPGGKKKYCKLHKKLNDVDVTNSKCIHPNCLLSASYGPKGKKRIYCSDHKMEEHTRNKPSKCIQEKCERLAFYGKKDGLPRYCSLHKDKEHVKLRGSKCKTDGCNRTPMWGVKGSKPIYCKLHREEDHIDLVHKRCIHPTCDKIASVGKPGYSVEFCGPHKKFGMIIKPLKVKDADFKECSYCLMKIHYSLEFCQGCFTYQKLGTTVKQHEKELAIKALLDENKIDYIHDIIIKDGCSRKRPDFRISTKWGNIILEVDEFQHKRKNYTAECEITRMKQIYFDSGVEQLLFIRYNPDDYKTKGTQDTTIKRQEYLIKLLREEISKDKRIIIPDNSSDSSDDERDDKKIGGIAVMYLYYDNFSKQSIEEQYIDPYIN